MIRQGGISGFAQDLRSDADASVWGSADAWSDISSGSAREAEEGNEKYEGVEEQSVTSC